MTQHFVNICPFYFNKTLNAPYLVFLRAFDMPKLPISLQLSRRYIMKHHMLQSTAWKAWKLYRAQVQRDKNNFSTHFSLYFYVKRASMCS